MVARPLHTGFSTIVFAALFGLAEAGTGDHIPSEPGITAKMVPDDGTLFRWWHAPDVSGGPDLNEPLVTDRPDFTEASVTVGRGVAQLEFGYTYAYDDTDRIMTHSHSWGEALIRYGVLADWLELRLSAAPVSETVRDAAGSVTASGIEDLYFGTKIALTPQSGWLPETAIVSQMTLPTGSDAFSDREVMPGVNWLYGWDVDDFLSTGGSTQVNRPVDGGGDYAEWAQSWTVGYGLSERFGAYTEWFALLPQGASEVQPEHYADGGLTYLITPDVQWDVRAGVGLNEAAEDFFTGTGLSVRFR